MRTSESSVRRCPAPLARRRRFGAVSACAGVLLWLAGCASLPPPSAEMAVAEAAVANAAQAGAMTWAPAEMRTAQDKLMRAHSALASKQHDRALMLANETTADAQLAASAARAAKAQKAADEVQEARRVLREEMRRGSSGTGMPAGPSP